VNKKKKTMYEILEVTPTASQAEIKAAHKRLSIQIMSGALGLSREDCDFRLNILDVALHTLSQPALRDAYDAALALAAPANAAVAVKANALALVEVDDAKASEIVAAITESHKLVSAGIDSHRPQIAVISSTVSASVRSLKTILRVTIGLLVLGSILTVGKMSFASRQGGMPKKEEIKAEEKLIILEYYKKYGVRPASRAEAEFLEIENRRRENEQRAAEFAEKRREEEYQRWEEESRHMGMRIHDDLVRNEQIEMQRQRQLAEEERFQEEMAKENERIRIENERRRYGLN
jgi:hypothetical protein